jgi:hypothetical protein
VWTAGNSAVLTLTNLVPSTAYSVYCLTMSAASVYSSLQTAVSGVVTASTACCKSITVSLGVDSLAFGTSGSGAITVTIGSLPSSSITVSLTAYQSGTSMASALFPSNVTFTSKSSSLTKLLSITNTVPVGSVTFVAALSGSSASEYATVTSDSATLTFQQSKSTFEVRAVNAAPATPSVVSARFSNDGVYVVVQFSSPTDRGGSGATTSGFTCTSVVQFRYSNASQCQWSSDGSSLSVRPSSLSKLKPGDNVTVLGSVLRAACPSTATKAMCAGYATVTATTMPILVPLSPARPVVLFSAPSVLGTCDSLVLDLSGSTGAAGRSWTTISFTVVSLDANASVIQTYLNSEYVMFPPTSISNSLFKTSYSYAITATLCNYLAACSSSTHQLVVVSRILRGHHHTGRHHIRRT